MILERYLFKELSGTLFAVTLVLFLIFVSSWFARLLGQVVTGAVQTDLLFELLFYMSVETLMVLLPLALFLSVLLTFGRLYKDSEMTAMLACGVSMSRVTRLVFLVGLGFALLIGAIALYLGPWAKGERYRLQEMMGATAGIEAVAAGQFRELADGKLVFYAERISDDGAFMENIFIQGMRDGRLNLVVADQGRQVRGPQGSRYLSLVNGSRYEGSPGQPDFRIIRFAEHRVLLEEAEIALSVNKTSALPTLVLWFSNQPAHIAELQWRFALPLSALLLAVLAVYLGKTTPRQGRYAKFFIGILVYMGYSNLIGMAQSWVESGKVSPQVGVWWVHLLLLMIIIFMAIRHAGGLRVMFAARPEIRSAAT